MAKKRIRIHDFAIMSGHDTLTFKHRGGGFVEILFGRGLSSEEVFVLCEEDLVELSLRSARMACELKSIDWADWAQPKTRTKQ